MYAPYFTNAILFFLYYIFIPTWQHNFQVADKKMLELEASRDLSKIWLHTDMDAFYAAVETLENPSLKGKPLAVGSMSMIATASYEVSILRYHEIYDFF